MANRNWASQKLFQMHVMPVMLDCNIAIGATGAVGTVNGAGIDSVTRLSAGTYLIKLDDNYSKLFQMDAMVSSPETGSSVADGSFVTGTTYEIVTLGTTTWSDVAAGVTPAVGVAFVATSAGGAGTGTAKAVGVSGINAVELVGNPNLTLSPNPLVSQGGYVMVQCLAPTSSSVTTQVATDPASGSTLYLRFYLSNSSVVISGE